MARRLFSAKAWQHCALMLAVIDDNKEVALGTSKINYCDPRISVAWCKANEVPIERVFPKTLRDKFVWALAVPPEWKFEDPKVKKRLGMPE